MEVKRYVTLEKMFCFCFHRKREAINLFWAKKNRFDQEKPLRWKQMVQMSEFCFTAG